MLSGRSGAAAPGLGDPYFPGLGNGGYDAKHYDIDLKVDIADNFIKGESTMQARAEQDLSSFDLDLAELDVARVKVDGKPAHFTRQGRELIISPEKPTEKGSDFSVSVDYSGHPKALPSMGGDFTVGWKNFGTGVTVEARASLRTSGSSRIALRQLSRPLARLLSSTISRPGGAGLSGDPQAPDLLPQIASPAVFGSMTRSGARATWTGRPGS